MNYNLSELNNCIKDNVFKDGDTIYCREYPNLLFKYEKNQFISYYIDGHDLYSDGPLAELIKCDKRELLFSKEPFNKYPKDEL